MVAKLTFLGTSGSLGIPVIGCKCHVCLSKKPQNIRSRPGALFEGDGFKILIDVGPDFYYQALKYSINHLDGVFLTHAHYDHIAGIDSLRVFSFLQKKPLPLFGSAATLDEVFRCYGYLFDKELHQKFTCNRLTEGSHQFNFMNLSWSFMFYHQIEMQVTGYRCGPFAYVTDVKEYDQTFLSSLNGVETLVISALEWNATRAHLGIDEVLEIGKSLNVRRLYITHLGHEIDHEITQKKLPSFAFLAYDGLSIDCQIT